MDILLSLLWFQQGLCHPVLSNGFRLNCWGSDRIGELRHNLRTFCTFPSLNICLNSFLSKDFLLFSYTYLNPIYPSTPSMNSRVKEHLIFYLKFFIFVYLSAYNLMNILEVIILLKLCNLNFICINVIQSIINKK